jgi:Domain of unknown function (DUF4253)
MEEQPNREDLRKRREEAVSQAIAAFPYERMEVAGDQALATWESLRASRPGSSPVVLGDDDQFRRIVQGSAGWPGGPTRRTTEQILDAAARLRHPDDLVAKHSSDMARARERAMQLMRERPDLRMPSDIRLPPDLGAVLGGTPRALSLEEMLAATVLESGPALGEWPSEPMGAPQLTVATETLSGSPLSRVQLVVLPTNDWTAIPAYLQWGNWNACPPPEYHVAALRSWRDRFGAELIGLSHDVMNIRVTRRPETRDAALDLAREQYVYCSDIVDQGVETLSALAAVLMESDWWYFWWD